MLTVETTAMFFRRLPQGNQNWEGLSKREAFSFGLNLFDELFI